MRETSTPGPWKWFNYPDGRKLLCADECGVIHCADGPMSISDPDARLIAAAPEMYEALKLALSEEGGFACPASTEQVMGIIYLTPLPI